MPQHPFPDIDGLSNVNDPAFLIFEVINARYPWQPFKSGFGQGWRERCFLGPGIQKRFEYRDSPFCQQ
jgi:hypothetical protein